MRFERDYLLSVVVGKQIVDIAPPMRITFDAFKSIYGGLNKLTAQIYNMKESNRLILVKDAEQQKRIPFALQVGYKGLLTHIFKGTVFKGATKRSGADFITTLESLDGGFDFLNSFTSKTVSGKPAAIDAILKDMPNTKKGKITKQNLTSRPVVLVGNSGKLIQQQLGPNETYYIDDETLYIINKDEVRKTFVPIVSPETGLLNTPERENMRVTFATLMYPEIKIGGKCELKSTTAPHLNGFYRIESIKYSGDYFGTNWMQENTGTLIKK